jgi:hypothetical protein
MEITTEQRFNEKQKHRHRQTNTEKNRKKQKKTDKHRKTHKKTVINKNTLYVFKHKWYNTTCWNQKDFTRGNVGKCMCAIPNSHDLPKFREDVLGDVCFYEEISERFPSEFIDHIIYKVRDTDL